MEKTTVKTTVIGKDHILLKKECGCKLHIYLTDQYEELCDKHKKKNYEQKN